MEFIGGVEVKDLSIGHAGLLHFVCPLLLSLRIIRGAAVKIFMEDNMKVYLAYIYAI